MVVRGVVENVVFQNKENGYTVIDIDMNGELITLVGKMPSVREGQNIEATGEFIRSQKWGEQFSVSHFEAKEPSGVEGIKKYLSSGLVKGIGPITAEAIVEKFGEKTLEVIEFEPQKLAEVRGISQAKAIEISKTLFELKKMQDTVMFLQQYDISTYLAVRIYETYQRETKKILEENPYKLIEDVSGIGFKTADKIAQKLGIPADSDFRIRAGILHILNESSDREGNTYLPEEIVIKNVEKLLEISLSGSEERLEKILHIMEIDGVIKEVSIDNQTSLMLTKFYVIERKLAQKLLLLKQQAPTLHLDLSSDIAEFERINKITFHSDQKEAIKLAINQGVCLITGGPGTGKTTIIKCILESLKKLSKNVALLAPTGRAAKRMSESCDYEAKTIHRALMVDPAKVSLNSDVVFYYNEHNKFPFDVVIVDEVSMVDATLAYNLCRALKPGAKLLLVGDKNQLPSVGAGNVLADIISSELIPYYNLTQIYRQEEASLIIRNAHAINRGEMPILDNKSKDFFFETKQDQQEIMRSIVHMQCYRIPKFLNIEPNKIQVLAPMRMGVCGVDNLNSKIQSVLNPQSLSSPEILFGQTIFRIKDKVMQTSNNYSMEWKRYLKENRIEIGEGVFNGDIGYITNIHTDSQSLEVTFEDGRVCEYQRHEIGELTLSYATTIHKSQGSEFDVVIIPMIGGAPSILTRNLLYTAVTRAKLMVVLVGQKFHLQSMIRNNFTAKRYSALKFFLLEQNKNLEILLNE